MERGTNTSKAAVATGLTLGGIFMLVGFTWIMAIIAGYFYALYHWTPESLHVWWAIPSIVFWTVLGLILGAIGTGIFYAGMSEWKRQGVIKKQINGRN